MDGLKDVVSYWGAIVSTVLAIDKLWSTWKSRPRVEITRCFTDDPDIGHEITIINISSAPIAITYWELVRGKSMKSKHMKSILDSSVMDFDLIEIPAYSSKKLFFSEMNHFSLQKSDAGMRIYIRLSIAGRKSKIVKLVYAYA